MMKVWCISPAECWVTADSGCIRTQHLLPYKPVGPVVQHAKPCHYANSRNLSNQHRAAVKGTTIIAADYDCKAVTFPQQLCKFTTSAQSEIIGQTLLIKSKQYNKCKTENSWVDLSCRRCTQKSFKTWFNLPKLGRESNWFNKCRLCNLGGHKSTLGETGDIVKEMTKQ